MESQSVRLWEKKMLNEIKTDAQNRMKKSIETLQLGLSKIRTGRANASFLDHVQVEYYGNPTPLNQVANINAADARTLVVTPWESTIVAAVEKAILVADLGLNPSRSGNSIRVPMPALTEERRKELLRLVKQEGEQARVAVRNVRRDANNHLKALVKSKDISEDEESRGEGIIQDLTDKFVAEVDALLAVKEKDLMDYL